MSRIKDYPAGIITADDYLLYDGANGTKAIKADQLAAELLGLIHPYAHRAIPRRKYLGDHVTEAQKQAIANQTWDDLFVGDYWIDSNGYTHIIADMNYWLNCGDSNFTTPHLVVVTDCNYSMQMNATNTTAGGYVGSTGRTTGLAQAKTIVKNMFGDMVLTHREYYSNAVTDGHVSGGAWMDSDSDLMNETMVYGCRHFSGGSTGAVTPAIYTPSNSQLALFQLIPEMIKIRKTYWLSDVVNASCFARVDSYGICYYNLASSSSVVRVATAVGVKK